MVRTETRTLPQPVGALRLGFYLDLHLRPLEGEVKQGVLPELGLWLLLDLSNRAIIPVLRRLYLIRLALFIFHIILLFDPNLLAVFAHVLDLFDKLLDIDQIVLIGLRGVKSIVKDGPLQFRLLCHLLTLDLPPIAQLARLYYFLQDSHLDLLVSFELLADGSVDMPQPPSQYRVKLIFYVVFRPACFIGYLPVRNLEI